MDSTPHARAVERYAALPIFFEKNEGQADPDVLYVSSGSGCVLSLARTEAVLSLRPARPRSDVHDEPAGDRQRPRLLPDPPTVVRMKIAGADPREVSGGGELAGKTHYFVGSDPGRWHTNVPHYERVAYRDVYPGVDLVYYGTRGRLEYDFVLSPGADPGRIRLRFEGPEDVKVDADGNLILEVSGGRLVQEAPAIYQEVAGGPRRVAGGYALLGGRDVGFEVGPYDRGRPLRIDPLIVYSTYLGGANGDSGQGVAVDASGSAYVTGYSYTTPLYGSAEVYVAKLSPDGSSLVYLALIGGENDDFGHAVAVDGTGSAYVTGYTKSLSFPTVNRYQTDPGDYEGPDAFVTKLSPSGSSLVYSTYLGGTGADVGDAIAVDGSGNAYVTGMTSSGDFPTRNPFQTDQVDVDAFVTKLSASGSSLVYSTYLGGSTPDTHEYYPVDRGYGIAVDGSGSAYVTGATDSADFPTAGPYQTDRGHTDAFVAKLSPDGTSLAYSTYLGGGDHDLARGIAVDASGNAYVAGTTYSADFPTLNPYQGSLDSVDIFATKLSPSGSSLEYSTYLGNGNGFGIAVDGWGSAYVAGDDGIDAVVLKLTPSGAGLMYSSKFSGNSFDHAFGIAVQSSGSAYVVGYTHSNDFPTKNPIQGYGGNGDLFVLKLVGPTPSSFYTLAPCRAVDTRRADDSRGGPLLACSSYPSARAFPLAGACGIPSTAQAVSYNVTVTEPTAAGHLRLFPAGDPLPMVSSLNYAAGATRANNGITLLGTGSLNVTCHQASGTAHVIIDVNGYFQ